MIMSSMENGRTHCGFRSIRQTTLCGRQPRGSCGLAYSHRARKKSGGIYDEPLPAVQKVWSDITDSGFY